MARIDETALSGQIRDKPVNDKLRRVLLAAADDAGIDVVRITSGGQPGSSGRRTGSHRHDDGNAADLELIKNNRTLDFTVPLDLETIRRFVTAAAAHGAIGIGAGVKYMGPTKLHVGFGNSPGDSSKLVWGAGGASANAPSWLRDAAQIGWSKPAVAGAWIPDEAWAPHFPFEGDIMANGSSFSHYDPEVERFRPLLDFIAMHEVGTTAEHGYNISLGHGRYLPGGREQDLVNKSLDEIYELGLYMRRQPGNPNSSALGRYQIVGQTLRGLMNKRGLAGSEKFSPEIQDRLAVDLVKGCGRDARRLGLTWASLKAVSADTIYAAYDQDGSRGAPATGPSQIDRVPPDIMAILRELMVRWQSDQASGRTEGEWPTLKERDSGDGVERLQTLLNGLQYFNGGADGKYGKLTRSAVALFQLDNGLTVTGVADADTWAALTNASARPLPDQRISITADDLRKLGSQTIKNADRIRYSGWLTGLLGLGGLGTSGACSLDPTLCAAGTKVAAATPDTLLHALQNLRSIPGLSTDTGLNQSLEALQVILQKAAAIAPAAKPAAEAVTGALPGILDMVLPYVSGLVPGPMGSLLALGLGFAFNQFGSNIIDRRVQDQRDGKHIGPASL